MHGGLRPLLLYAKPWQRVALGAVLVAVGLAVGATILPVLGGALVVGTLYGAVRTRRTTGSDTDDEANPGPDEPPHLSETM